MANSYFRCKQFTIHQDRCAMKVGTDAMVLGAWVDLAGAQTILDVGTGTGLLALMLAQRSPARIDAIEIDGEAVLQAQENVARSPWPDRIEVSHQSVQAYANRSGKQYDLLIANPPFFVNSSPSPQPARTMARHSDTLSPTDLLQAATQLLAPAGRLALIYPPDTVHRFQSRAESSGWFCQRKLHLRPTASQPVTRIGLELSRSQLPCQESTLPLRTAQHHYTAEFIALIQDFYLKY